MDAEPVALMWDANAEPDVNRYRLYGASFSNLQGRVQFTNYVEVSTNTITLNLAPNLFHYFTVTAVNTSNLESEFSNVIFVLFVRENKITIAPIETPHVIQ